MAPQPTRLAGWLGLVLLLFSTAASAQIPPLSDSSRVSLLTILPGDAVYSEFGHSAFRITDPEQGIDRVYNYGTFDFRDPWFIPKFVYGRLDYMLSVTTYPRARQHYEVQRRPIIEQELRLTRTERSKLFRFLEINARPENRTYRYDFLFDNCSTRLRDALKTVMGDSLQFPPAPDPQKSFRHLLDIYVADRPALDLGFDLGLGQRADRVASPWETMFLPNYLMAAFDHATVASNGTARALVTRTDTLYWIDGYDATERAFDWPTLLGWLLLIGGLGLTGWNAARTPSVGRRFDAALLLVAGLAGVLMVFLWFIAEHTVTNQNWNLLWAWPTHLWAAVVLWRSSVPKDALRYYLTGTAGLSAVVAAGWAIWPQDLHAAVLPLVMLLGLRAGWQAYHTGTPADEPLNVAN